MFNNPVPLIKDAKVPYGSCAYIFGFSKQFPEDIIALMSHHLAEANNILHCLSLHPAKSAGWIPIKQAHNIQVPPHRNMACEDCNCYF
jgi:hypothetical protein